MTDLSSLSLSLHHVGYLVKDIDAAAAHYTSTLGYTIESDVIEDPVQTARVQFLRLPGGSSWLELISPLTAESKLSNALKKGVLLHHLCYEVVAMEPACNHLRQRGCFQIAAAVPALAFSHRPITWWMDKYGFLFELVEAGSGKRSLQTLQGDAGL